MTVAVSGNVIFFFRDNKVREILSYSIHWQITRLEKALNDR